MFMKVRDQQCHKILLCSSWWYTHISSMICLMCLIQHTCQYCRSQIAHV
jgi:hypothetical protein